MNTQQLVDSIRQIFPDVSRTQIRLDLDTAQKLLADETETIIKIASLSAPSTNVAWSLPSNFAGFVDLNFYDANGEPLYAGTLNYKWEIVADKFYIYSTTSTPITGLAVTYAYLTYKSLPATLSTEATSLEMTGHYRDAIESYVLGKYFAKFPINAIANGQVVKVLNLQAAQLHKAEYDRMRIKIKRLFNSRVKTDNEYMNYPHAGKYQLPKRVKDVTTGSVVLIGALSEIYTDYAYFLITTTGTITPSIQVGFATISCSVVGDTITLTSTGEFTAGFIINLSNEDTTYSVDSTSQITFTLPSGWTEGSFEIYKRV